MTTCGPATRETLARGPESGYPTVNATRDVVISMKSLVITAAAAVTLTAGAAQAVTVAATDADNASVTVGGGAPTVGQNINGNQITFTLEGTSEDPRTSAAIRFSLPGAGRLTFDEYPGSQSSGYVLYQIDGPTLSDDGLFAPTGVTVPLVGGQEGSRIGNSGSTWDVTPGVIVDSISGGGGFVPGGDWVLGFWDAGDPLTGDIKFTITAVPLPASAWLLLAGVGALAWRSRRKAA